MTSKLDILRGGLVVSCQPVPGGPLDQPAIVAAFARAARDGGAVGLRIEGLTNLLAVRAVTDAPIIGLIKRDLTDSPVRITPYLADAHDLAQGGADIVAFDATDRARPDSVADLIKTIHAAGALAMADCADAHDATRARDLGADILGSTLSGYTDGPTPDAPDLALVTQLAQLGRFVVAEGRYNAPSLARQARDAGADALVVGSAITRPEHITGWFAHAFGGRAPHDD